MTDIKDYDLELLHVIKAVADEETLEDTYLTLKKLMDAYAKSQCATSREFVRELAYNEGYECGYSTGFKDGVDSGLGRI